MNIKKSEFDSALVLLGKAVSLGEINNENIGKLFDAVSSVKTSISNLPCDVNDKRIKDVEKWQNDCVERSGRKALENYKGSISLKNAVIGGIALTIFTIGLTLLISWATSGCPG